MDREVHATAGQEAGATCSSSRINALEGTSGSGHLPAATIRCSIRVAYQAADASLPMGMSKLAADHGNFAGKSISLQPAGARIFSWAGEKGTGERRYDPDNRREPYFGFLRARWQQGFFTDEMREIRGCRGG